MARDDDDYLVTTPEQLLASIEDVHPLALFAILQDPTVSNETKNSVALLGIIKLFALAVHELLEYPATTPLKPSILVRAHYNASSGGHGPITAERWKAEVDKILKSDMH